MSSPDDKSTLNKLEEDLYQKVSRAFNSIDSIERITFLQFRNIETYEGSDGSCSREEPCIIADIQLTIKHVNQMNYGLSLSESTTKGLEIAKKEVYKILDKISLRGKRNSDKILVEYASPITPIGENQSFYVLTAACVFGSIGFAIYYFKTKFHILYLSHKMVWNEGSGILTRVKVVKECLVLLLISASIVTETLACRDYLLGRRKEST